MHSLWVVEMVGESCERSYIRFLCIVISLLSLDVACTVLLRQRSSSASGKPTRSPHVEVSYLKVAITAVSVGAVAKIRHVYTAITKRAKLLVSFVIACFCFA
jgi:hypothetical protein